MTFVGFLAALDPPAQNLSIFEPVSPPAESIRDLAIFTLAITGVIFAIVEGLLVYAVFRFRHGAPTGAEPPQVYGSMPIEIAWTVAPTLVVFVLALVIARTLWEVKVNPYKPPPDSAPVRVTVIGHQWWWEYVYPRSSPDNKGGAEQDSGKAIGFATANELHVPGTNFAIASERRPVYLTLQSADVCHSFWVPRLAGKTDLIPGRTNTMWFETGQKEWFLGQCAEFCGTQHAKMLLRVKVDAPEDFARWVQEQEKPAVDDPVVSKEKEKFFKQSCVNCHRIRGTGAAGTYGPDLTHLMSRETLASGIVPNNRENLRKWIVDPQKVKPGCLMPAFGLNAQDLNDIVAYLATLR